jgi:hypothetical protein
VRLKRPTELKEAKKKIYKQEKEHEELVEHDMYVAV